MKMTQPLMMILDFFNDVFCDAFQVEGGYISESEFNGKTVLEFCSAAGENFENEARMEFFLDSLQTVADDMNAKNADCGIIYDEDTRTLLADRPEDLLDLLTRFSETYDYGWDAGIDGIVSIPEGFELTQAFREQAEASLSDPTLLRALDHRAVYASRDDLYLAALKIEHYYEGQYPARPHYTLDDIRGALQADQLRELAYNNPQQKMPHNGRPCFWLN